MGVGKEIGKAHIDVHFDGDSLPGEAEALGRTASKGLTRELNKSFSKALSGRIADFASAMDRSIRSTERSTAAHRSHWRQLSANTRQWILISSAIAAAGTNIAALGSAAGAGLLVLGAASASAVIGIGATIAAFKGLTGELADLPPTVRPAARAFQALGKAFDRLQDRIQIAALDNAAGAFESLERTVDGLVPAFESVGESIGRIVDGFARGLAPGTRNFANLNRLIKVSGPIFERLAKVVGTFSEALLEAFASPEMTKSVGQMIDWLQELGDAFLDFTRSDELGVWLRRAEDVFSSLGGLLRATGQMLNDLVDDAAVKRLTDFLDNLTDFMPHLENLLSIIGELDIFGLIAQTLADLGRALEPLAGPMEDLFDALNSIVSIAIDEWSKDLKGVAEALAPVTQALADFLSDVKPREIRAVADALLALAAAALVVKGAQGLAGLAGAVSTNLHGLGASLKGATWKSIGTTMGKAGAISFLPALIAGLFAGDSLSGLLTTTLVGAFAGISFGPIGLVVGALLGSIVSMFTAPETWAEVDAKFKTMGETWWNDLMADFEIGAQQIKDFMATAWQGIMSTENWDIGAAQIDAAVKAWWADLMVQFQIGGGQIVVFFAKWMTDLGTNFNIGATQIRTGFSNWMRDLGLNFQIGANQIRTGFSNWMRDLGLNFQIGAGQIRTGVSNWWRDLGLNFQIGANQIRTGVSNWWRDLGSQFRIGWSQITTGVRNWWRDLTSQFSIGAGQIRAAWSNLWSGFTGVVSGVASRVSGIILGISSSIRKAIQDLQGLLGLRATSGNGGGGGGMASGGIVTYGARRLIGEAGPEAVVPLNRPLAQVDPAVRELSAYAQGIGGSRDSGRGGVIIQSGAIQIVTPARDPFIVARIMLDDLVTKVTG